MTNTVIRNKIKDVIATIPHNENNIIVLKGIPMSVVDPENANIMIENVLDNKLGYFMNIYKKRQFVTYEEYLLLKSFILDQYESVYILNNNVYMEQVPIYVQYSQETVNGLIVHFSESDDDEDERIIGKKNIQEIIGIYEGIKEYNNYLIGAYLDTSSDNEQKIHTFNLFEPSSLEIKSVDNVESDVDFIELHNESDYIDLVRRFFEKPEEIYVSISNYEGDADRLKDHISILAENWADYTDVFYIQNNNAVNEFEHRDEYTHILKKYWGYDEFREFNVYDIDKLERGEKTIKKVSQEQIISDIVNQVENCNNGQDQDDYRDVFVTAPTGSGKSVIFQVPAIYLAEKYNLLTIVVSPLIGLMNDQINGLEKRNYKYAKTINSDISPIVKDEILSEVAESKLHILYLSPETLLARSNIEQLVGDRTIGMIVIDEAHIVTTWGKQFRPDYWYLGDHINKLRRNQKKKTGQSFVIASFTATAIYHGIEDMYDETRNSLHMRNPITYLGYVKRNDITVRITKKVRDKNTRNEYDLVKIDMIKRVIERAKITGKKTLIYFPTVSLINSCYQYLENEKMVKDVTVYYGPLPKDQKDENYQMFLNGERLVMFATKAFGMGIDIDNIEIVAHYAPTGNVCDYVQEIGRAARRSDLQGEAYYEYNSKDFKFINRLHGLSSIKKYQLIEVVKKIVELYDLNRKNSVSPIMTKKTNAMLIDAENFTYIFGTPISDEDNNINRVKTALLMIQKDFENRNGFSPINVRPIPLYSIGFFEIAPGTQELLNKNYNDCCKEIYGPKHICRVNLNSIWSKRYKKDCSFPQFKYFIYSRSNEIDFSSKYTLKPALCVSIKFEDDFASKFSSIWECLRRVAQDDIISEEFIRLDAFIIALNKGCGVRKYKAQTICEVLIASMQTYKRKFQQGTNAILQQRELKNGETMYRFNTAAGSFFDWVERGFRNIVNETKDGQLYITDANGRKAKEYSTILGILEALNVLTFEMSGGADSQLYIYINQIRSLYNIKNNPGAYKNRLLETVAERHLISVKMLTYIFEGGFSSDEIWDIIEDYFLGRIPERVKSECRKENPNIVFPS